MKNKSKLNKIKNQNKSEVKLPQGWFFMTKKDITVVDFKNIVPAEADLQIWEEMGVAELEVAEKASIDFEQIDSCFGDEFSDSFVSKNQVKAIFYVSFKSEIYNEAKIILKKMAEACDGFVCADTEDFKPFIK